MRKANFILFFACFFSSLSFSQMKAQMKSSPLKALPILEIPIAIAATEITSNGFTANWSLISNVDGYFIDVYTYTPIALTENTTVSLLNENFDNFTAGTIAIPDNTNIGTGFINASYTSLAGWYGNQIYQAGGNMYMPTDAWIYTPSMNLSTGSKHFSIKITFAAASADATLIIAHTPDGNGKTWESNITASNFLHDDLNGDGIDESFYGETDIQTQTYSYDFYQGDVSSCIYIEPIAGNVTISNIEIIQDQNIGDKIENVIATLTVNGGNIISENIDGLDVNKEYAYRLRSFTGTVGNYNYSNASNEIFVDKSFSDNKKTETNSSIVYCNNGNIYVKLMENSFIQVFNANGQLIKSENGIEGINEIPLLHYKGILYIKTGQKTSPVIL